MKQKNAEICYKKAGYYRLVNEAIKNLFEHNNLVIVFAHQISVLLTSHPTLSQYGRGAYCRNLKCERYSYANDWCEC